MNIPNMKIYIPEEDRKTILERTDEVLKSSILTDYKYCREFEKEFASYIGTKYAISTNSGTGALEIMIRALKLKGEIIVPTNTFAATIYAIIKAGCKPVFVDSDYYMHLDYYNVGGKFTEKTVAVMTVHIGGYISEDIVLLKEFCDGKGIYLLEDACHAHGSMYNGKKAGSFGQVAGFSFFPTKVIGSAEGGMMVTDDEYIKNEAEIYRDQGKTKGNICSLFGYNWRMNEIQAIIGLTQLKRIEEFINSRTKLASYYDSENIYSSLVINRLVRSNSRPNYYKYIVYLLRVNINDLKVKLKEQGISLSGDVYEVPCHLNPVFKDLGYDEGDFPMAEYLSKRHICFPMMSNLTLEQAEYFIDCLKKDLKEV